MAIKIPARSRRRLAIALGVSLTFALVLVAALPVLLGTGAARRWLLRRADLALTPGRFEYTTIHWSWFGATRLTGLALIDAQGDRVLDAPRGTWDRNLFQVLFDGRRRGTLLLDGARIEAERRADGTIDLFETLKPVLSRDPRTELRVRIRDGRLRFRDAGQPVAVVAEHADLDLDVPAAPRATTWRLRLENPGTPEPESLEVAGQYGRWEARPGHPGHLEVEVSARRWPWAYTGSGIATAGRLDGRFTLALESGRWASSGRAEILALDATGPRLAGDHLRLDHVAGTWDLAEAEDSWAIRRLDLDSPLLSLKAKGPVPAPPGSSTTIEGDLDLAGLARQLPHTLPLREGITLDRGAARVRVESSTGRDERAWDLDVRVSDLQAHDPRRQFTLRDPALLSARLVRRNDIFSVDRMAVRTAFLEATGRGDLDRGVSWSGTLDLGGLRRQLEDLVDFGAIELAGKGEMSGRYRRSGAAFEGHLATELHDLKVAGLAPGTIRRDSVRLDLSLEGTTTPSGLPRSWSVAKVGASSGMASAELAATSDGDGTAFNASARVPFDREGRKDRAETTLDARWDEAGVAIKRLVLALVPGPDAREASPVEVALRGRFNRAAGELTLTADPDAPAGAIALAPEGIQVSGIGRAGTLRATIGLAGDLDPVARLVAPHQARSPWAGSWSARATAQETRDGLRLVARVDVHDRSPEPKAIAGFSLNALYPKDADRLDIDELVLASPYATLEGSGRLSDLRDRRLADLRGTLSPDWKAINGWLSDRVEPRAHLSGKSRAWQVRGPLQGDSTASLLKSLEGEFGLDLIEADIYGLHVGPTPVVLRGHEGKLGMDPIDTTLNQGKIHLEPTIVLDDERGVLLRLDSSSTVTDAQINDEVSRRFLSYVAPILDRATRAHGLVSVNLKEAVFPITGGSKRGTNVEGAVVFRDVEFLPGPFADALFDLIGREERPGLKLDQPVALTIADRRVYQRGLAIPLGRLTQVELEGWVDFDRKIELVASLPLTSAMVGNRPLLSAIVEGTRIRVPIRGSLQKPEIDRQAMNLALQDMSKTLLERGVVQGAAEILSRLSRGRDPNAPPPPTLEERRARRMERKAQRRLNRGIEP